MSETEIPAADRTVRSTDNNPPELTPFEAAREMISTLDAEAAAWAGTPIENERQAAVVAKLLDDARKASKQADGARKVEKEPFEKAKKEVDEKWKPLIADADRIVECARKAQTIWLIKLDEAKRAAEAEANRIAQEKIDEARRLAAEADGSVEAAKVRDAAIEEARRAERSASRASHEKAGAKGDGMARSIGLRTVYRPQIDDRRLLLNHIATRDPAALIAFVEDWAAKSVRAGARAIPGVTVIEERCAA